MDSRRVPGLARVTLERYLSDKVQCIVERLEARDLFDIQAVLAKHPELTTSARASLAGQDALMVAERLAGWTDEDIQQDLRAYPGVDPAAAVQAREILLSWIREQRAQMPEDMQ